MVDGGFAYSVADADDDAVRLDLFESLLDPATLSSLQQLGIRRGSRCLEVGAGRGSVLMHLLGMVGPRGEVVATEVDMTWLDQIRHPCLLAVEHDLTTDDLGSLGQFDFIHVRMVLHHFGAAGGGAALSNLAALLRPGGRLLVEDLVNPSTMVDPASPDAERFAVLDAMWRPLTTAAGHDMAFGLRLPGLLKRSGLEAVDVAVTSTVDGGDEPGQQWRRRTLRRLQSKLIEDGLMTREQYDELDRLLERPDLHQLSFLRVASWGTRSLV